MATPSQQHEIMLALHPYWNEFITGIQARITLLSSNTRRTPAEERELHAALGLNAIFETLGTQGLKDFSRWAIHDISGFMFPTQKTKPLPKKIASLIETLIATLPDPTPVDSSTDKKLSENSTLSRRRYNQLLGVTFGSLAGVTLTSRIITKDFLTTYVGGLLGSYLGYKLGPAFLAKIEEENHPPSYSPSKDKAYKPMVDDITPDMVRLLACFYELRQEYEKGRGGAPALG